MFETTLNIDDILDSNIPGIKILHLRNNDYEVKVEYHTRMGLNFEKNQSVKLIIGDKDENSELTNGVYCGNAFLYSIKEKEQTIVLLFSIGGLILRIESPDTSLKNIFEISKEYKFCIK